MNTHPKKHSIHFERFLLHFVLAVGSWPEIEYGHATRFSKLMEFYQDVVLVEKQDKQDYSRRMTPKKHKFASLTVCKFSFSLKVELMNLS